MSVALITRGKPGPGIAETTRLLVSMLRRTGFEFEILHHRRTTSAAAEARVLGVLPQVVAKTLVAVDDEGRCIRAVVPASAHVSIAKLAEAVSANVDGLLTEADLVRAYPQFELGAVPPFGGPAGDRVVVDYRLEACDHVVFDGGAHDTSLRMRTTDLIELSQAVVADIAADEIDP
jgi:Ala-tRNA(Pro) deacylase